MKCPIERKIKIDWPLITSIALLWMLVAVFLILSLKQNQGHLVYALDDPYIHMAMAKNFVQSKVLGITKDGFTSSSSSLLQLLLLSIIYFFFGVNEITPLILNIVFATLIVYLIYVLLRQYKFPLSYIFAILLLIIFSTPLTSLIFTGMEHLLHTLLTISFVYLSAKVLLENRSNFRFRSLLLILAPLVVMARYEGLFLVFVVAFLFILKRRFLLSFFLLGLAIIPIAIYGLISISNGWYFLPNSVLIKSNALAFSLKNIYRIFYYFALQMLGNQNILILFSLALLLLIFQFNRKETLWQNSTVMLIIFIGTVILHMFLANTGHFFRYEAYLVALGISVVALATPKYLPKKLSVFIVILLLPFVFRGFISLITPQATTNIYQQQYQMALFLKQFYQGEVVAANDIGAINYLSEIKCLDLWGLASLEVAKMKMAKNYNPDQIYNLAKQKKVKIAIVYDRWFEEYGGLPPLWIKVGQWKISNNVVAGEDTVSFYAVDPEEKNRLIKNLKIFSSQLPKDVKQLGDYLN